jgi:hypothetical protein
MVVELEMGGARKKPSELAIAKMVVEVEVEMEAEAGAR